MSEFAELAVVQSNVVFTNHHKHTNDDAKELLEGLKSKPKKIDPKFFYDTYGSELFEQITQLPEYYPTRTERKLLEANAAEIAMHCGEDCVLIEPGSGSSEKVRLILDEIRPQSYVPMDIAAEFLKRSATKLSEEFPWLDIRAICADFASLEKLPCELPEGDRVVFYPGSTLGNMLPKDAQLFLQVLRNWLDDGESGGMIIGIDLHKSTDILHAAYNDKQSVTAEFNLNVLNNVNNILNSNFDTDRFSHKAFYNEDERRIEMHLVSQVDHCVELDKESISFAEGESIHTENSYKYTLDSFEALVQNAGFSVKQSWIDDDELFSIHYLEVR